MWRNHSAYIVAKGIAKITWRAVCCMVYPVNGALILSWRFPLPSRDVAMTLLSEVEHGSVVGVFLRYREYFDQSMMGRNMLGVWTSLVYSETIRGGACTVFEN